jgi:hypothetical protein
LVGCHSAEHHFVARHSDANATMPQVSYSAVKKVSKRETKNEESFLSSFFKKSFEEKLNFFLARPVP